MKKIPFTLGIGLAFIFSSLTFASSLIDNVKILQKKFDEKISKVKIAKNISPGEKKCLNFSGNWEGVCQNSWNKDPYDHKISIMQFGCTELSFMDSSSNAGTYRINHVSTLGQSGEGSSSSGATVTRWNKQGDMLKTTGIFLEQTLSDRVYIKRGKLNQQIYVNDQQLIHKTNIQMTLESDSDVDQLALDEICTYKKVRN